MADLSTPSVIVDPAGLIDFTAAVLRATGMDEAPAAAGADVLCRTTMRGVESHGVSYLHQYVKQLREGGANPKAEIGVIVDRGALAVVDADAGLGPSMAAQITTATIDRARTHGIAMTSVRNANHFGAAGHYGLLCAEAGCIGLVMSNTPPIMAVTGSRSRSIGNGPLSFGAPRTGAPPFVLDIAMSRVAGGKIRMAIQNGQRVPLGWIVDPEGNPTTVPEDFLVRRGALLPMEDHKGYGLSLMVETLSGALSGAAMLGSVRNWIYDPATPSDTGYFLFVIDVGSDGAFPDFSDRLRALCAEVTASPRAPGVERIFVPGEIEHEAEQRAWTSGLALRPQVWAKLRVLAEGHGLDPALSAMKVS
ncbi:MAG: Ldh family oxidoreductase [Nitriliruptorales bacterium]|nr:Ldh family oxidoreductase [Nitriliruptorales bacterium]